MAKLRGRNPGADKLAARAAGQPVERMVPVELIDPPEDAAREQMDEDKLGELIDSIRNNGLINPLTVIQQGPRVRIYAGHRRFISCSALGWREIPCRVWPEGTPIGESLMAHENAFREDLNPAEEARKFGRLLEGMAGGDVDRLCEVLHLKRPYVEGRLILLRGDADVLQALAAGHIGMSVAVELNKVEDNGRRAMYLRSAIDGGASARIVRDWRERGNAFDALQRDAPAPDPDRAVASGYAPAVTIKCELCEGGPADGPIMILYVHNVCKRQFFDRLLKQIDAREV